MSLPLQTQYWERYHYQILGSCFQTMILSGEGHAQTSFFARRYDRPIISPAACFTTALRQQLTSICTQSSSPADKLMVLSVLVRKFHSMEEVMGCI